MSPGGASATGVVEPAMSECRSQELRSLTLPARRVSDFAGVGPSSVQNQSVPAPPAGALATTRLDPGRSIREAGLGPESRPMAKSARGVDAKLARMRGLRTEPVPLKLANADRP